MTAYSEPITIDWEDEGRRLAPELDQVSAAVVVGRDPVAAAKVALGIGRVQARRRRVAIGDLVGEISALQALVPGGEGHGLVDSFLYGVSLTKIAHPIDAAKNLFVLPSGMEPIDYDAILRSDRWAKLTEGFREVEGLLLVLVPARASGLEALVESVDGAIVVGDERRSVPGRVIAAVRPAALPEQPSLPLVADDELAGAFDRGSGRRVALIVAIVILAIAAIAAALWAVRGRSGGATTPAASAVIPPDPRTSDSAAGAVQNLPVLLARADSTQAAAYAVELFKLSSVTEANGEVDGASDLALPAVTYTPMYVGPDSARWYALLAGAFRERAEAESLLITLRLRGLLLGDRGTLVRAPFALLLVRGVTLENAPGLVSAYHSRGLPVYALRQSDGSASLYAGAFATVEDAAPLAAMFRSAGEQFTVTYRIGRGL